MYQEFDKVRMVGVSGNGKSISYVPQTIELFSKSIYDNIRVSKMNSTLDEVKEAAKAVMSMILLRKYRCNTIHILKKLATAYLVEKNKESHFQGPF